MRIVHQFYSKKPQCGGSGQPYAIKITEPPPAKMPGFQVELLACDADGKGDEGDALHLEGDGTAIKNMLKGLLHIVESTEEHCRQQYEETRKKTKLCKTCKKWFAHKHDCEHFKDVT